MGTRLLAAAALTAFAFATQQVRSVQDPQRPVFRSGTVLVQLDVVVLDGDGRPVRGLTADDFTILDEGRERPVVAVNEFHHDPPRDALIRQDVATNSSERLAVIVLDDKDKFGPRLDRARTVAREVIRRLAGRAQLALVRSSMEPGVEFTTNAQALLDALDLPPVIEPAKPRPFTPNWSYMGDPTSFVGMQLSEMSPAISSSGLRPAGPVGIPPNTDFFALRDGVVSANDGRRKSFIIITEGDFYSRLPGDFRLADIEKFQRGTIKDSRLLEDLHERLKAVLKAAQRTNSTVSVINPSIDSDRPVSASSAFLRAALTVLTKSTGGYTSWSNDRLSDVLERMTTELDHYYVLGFEPPDPNNTKARAIDVRVRRAGLTARTRTTYQMDQTATKRALAAAKKDPLLGLVYSAVPTRDLPLRLWATVLPAAGSGPPQTALWLDTGGTHIREYAVFTIDMSTAKELGKPVGRTLTGAIPELLPLDTPPLQPGRYQLRVAARDDSVGGSVYLTLTVPDFSREALAITGLIVGVDGDDRPDTKPLPFAPALDRTFEEGARLRVGFQLWRHGVNDDVQTAIELVTEGKTVRRIERTIPATDAGRFVASLPSAELAPGAYTLRVIASGGGFATKQELAITIKRP